MFRWQDEVESNPPGPVAGESSSAQVDGNAWPESRIRWADQ